MEWAEVGAVKVIEMDAGCTSSQDGSQMYTGKNVKTLEVWGTKGNECGWSARSPGDSKEQEHVRCGESGLTSQVFADPRRSDDLPARATRRPWETQGGCHPAKPGLGGRALNGRKTRLARCDGLHQAAGLWGLFPPKPGWRGADAVARRPAWLAAPEGSGPRGRRGAPGGVGAGYRARALSADRGAAKAEREREGQGES